MAEEINPQILALLNEAQEEKNRRLQADHNQVATMFQSEDNENLIRFQLDIEKEIERIEHLIRKHKPYYDAERKAMDYKVGFIKVLVALYKTSDNIKFYFDFKNDRILGIKDLNRDKTLFKYGEPSLNADNLWEVYESKNDLKFIGYQSIQVPDILLNEEGVNEVLHILSWYVNKTFLLSDFDEEEINLRIWQFGKDLANFLHKNFGRFGLDTPEKITHYDMLVTNIINIVEAVYHRALYGKERDSLRQARIVSQSENLNQNNPYPQKSQKGGFNIMKPSTW